MKLAGSHDVWQQSMFLVAPGVQYPSRAQESSPAPSCSHFLSRIHHELGELVLDLRAVIGNICLGCFICLAGRIGKKCHCHVFLRSGGSLVANSKHCHSLSISEPCPLRPLYPSVAADLHTCIVLVFLDGISTWGAVQYLAKP